MNGFPSLPLILLVAVAINHVGGVHLMEKSTSRCENVCNITENLQKDLQGDCQRGCQYFNIEFLISAADTSQVASIQTYADKCKTSCSEAYDQTKRRNACFLGCTRMSEIQEQAPYINNWIIYMGASDKGMVLLPSDTEALSANDWIMLESFLKGDDDDYEDDLYKITDTVITEEHGSSRERFLLTLSLPSWLWFIPFLMVMWLIWNSFGGTSSCHSPDDFTQNTNEIISNDKTMYPSLAVLPPKYSELERDFFSETEDEQQLCAKDVRT